ncbi:MAG: D-alanyl-D-alanine carboxypeptidase, partial [Candidatus Omnitrophica bacterium]|nr:D-alanyl-D-alanine carboxypeptidase [Candidatus Omnitrophota bacterium]
SSKINLRENETYLTRDLLEAVLICSANDASVALACDIAGTEEAFVRMMNNRARQLGALNTNFVNSTGLPTKGQYTSAYDLVVIMKRALIYPEIIEIMTKRDSPIKSDKGRLIGLKSHNKLLWEFDNAIIGKTGYTRQAGHCFVGLQKIKNRKFLFAILKSKDPRPDIRIIYSTLTQLINNR